MASWVEMDFLTSCNVFKNQLKSLFDLSEIVGCRSYFLNVEFCLQFKSPKTVVQPCGNGWTQLSGFIFTKGFIMIACLAELFVMQACNYSPGLHTPPSLAKSALS